MFVYGGVLACGGPSLTEKAHLPLPLGPAGALLAKPQPEAKPVVASPDAELPVIGSSHLYLGVNGCARENSRRGCTSRSRSDEIVR